MTSRKLEAIGEALDALLSGECDSAARRFAERYAAFDGRRQRERVLARALDLLALAHPEARRPSSVRVAS